MRRVLGLIALLGAGACGARSRAGVEHRIALPAGSALKPSEVSFSPRGHVQSVRIAGGFLRFTSDGAALTVAAPGLCPLTVGRSAKSARAAALLDVPEALAQVGYDAPFTIAVRAGCAQAEHYALDWQLAEGSLAELVGEARGFRVRGRTPTREALLGSELPSGVVPVSARSQGRALLTWHASAPGLPDLHGSVLVTAIARSTGLTSLAVSQRVLLGGGDYTLVRAPGGSRASVEPQGGVPSFAPDLPGRYQLRGPAGDLLELQAMRHDHTPMDCGRAECHAAIGASTLASPMSFALTRPALPRDADRSCMLGCHAVGEPGLDDGGFSSVRAALAHPARLDGAHLEGLPPQLTRMAGVRCTSCHGPGAIPTQGGRARILRTDVCATCHDAPPRYTHVAEWRASRMARADASPGSDAPSCAPCHTTGGFLHATGLRVRGDRSHDDTAVGIACAACHAPHGPRLGAGLVRELAAPDTLPTGAAIAHTPSALCAQCHAPTAQGSRPQASAAALWLGSVRLPTSLGGEVLSGPAPHAELAGGCLACHGKRSDSGARKHTGHDFAVDPAVCTRCHADGVPDGGRAELVARSASLRVQLTAACASAQASAHAAGESPCARPEFGRARYLLELVSEDPAAHAHNAPFARALLDGAERALTRTRPRP